MNIATLPRPAPGLQTIHHSSLENCNDQAIMQSFCSDGAEWALEQLYERYHHSLYLQAYRILGDSHLAEDVIQDVFLTLWHKASSYQKELGSLKSWLQAIVRNRALDKVRSSAYREYQFLHLQAMDGQDVSISGSEIWEQVWGSEQSMLIRKALAQLPPEQRQVIELNYFSDYTHAEIARQLQLPIGTVKGRIRLGLQKIKLLLQGYGIDARTVSQKS